jgi:hypothetical protein
LHPCLSSKHSLIQKAVVKWGYVVPSFSHTSCTITQVIIIITKNVCSAFFWWMSHWVQWSVL